MIAGNIEHIFTGIDVLLGNKINKETSYLDDKIREIEVKQKEIDSEMKNRMSNHSQSAPVQAAPTTINNSSTVMSMRESVKNTDDSFNRYLSSVLG
jgi:polyhydroxyalkanoate synthesis regulator phasin